MDLDHTAYLEAIQRESTRFRNVLAGVDPDARVPSCPEWTAADLLWHLTEVQEFWAGVVRSRPAAPADEGEPPRPDVAYDGLLARYDRALSGLLDALGSADPSEPAWSWSEDQRMAFTYRRMAHEALIHRVDAEETGGVRTPLDPVLASDGVAEALAIMLGGCPGWATFTGSGERARVILTDTGAELTVELGRFRGTGPESGREFDDPTLVVLDEPADADVTIRGTAEAVDTWLWRRGDADEFAREIRVEGDRGVYERFRAVVDQPIL